MATNCTLIRTQRGLAASGIPSPAASFTCQRASAAPQSLPNKSLEIPLLRTAGWCRLARLVSLGLFKETFYTALWVVQVRISFSFSFCRLFSSSSFCVIAGSPPDPKARRTTLMIAFWKDIKLRPSISQTPGPCRPLPYGPKWVKQITKRIEMPETRPKKLSLDYVEPFFHRISSSADDAMPEYEEIWQGL